jgi:hypothetical protein
VVLPNVGEFRIGEEGRVEDLVGAPVLGVLAHEPMLLAELPVNAVSEVESQRERMHAGRTRKRTEAGERPAESKQSCRGNIRKRAKAGTGPLDH